jgi:hypothetical protein
MQEAANSPAVFPWDGAIRLASRNTWITVPIQPARLTSAASG